MRLLAQAFIEGEVAVAVVAEDVPDGATVISAPSRVLLPRERGPQPGGSAG